MTAGQTIYEPKGILETEQETIIATRNARVVQTDVSQTTSRLSTSTRDRTIQVFQQDDGGDDGGKTIQTHLHKHLLLMKRVVRLSQR